MDNVCIASRIRPDEPETSATVFQQEWRIYRKMVDHDY
jgi:hypothetical protein